MRAKVRPGHGEESHMQISNGRLKISVGLYPLCKINQTAWRIGWPFRGSHWGREDHLADWY